MTNDTVMGDRPFALARKASGAAQRRLREAHIDEYDALLAEERVKRGLSASFDKRDKAVYEELRRLREELSALKKKSPESGSWDD